MVWVTLAVAVAVPAGWFALTYNRLVHGRNLVDEAWSGVDVQLKRRSDLIPAIVNAVRAYGKHEVDTLAEVTLARIDDRQDSAAEARAASESEVSRYLGRLMAVAEDYPEVRADQSYLELQRTLSEVEDHIQLARRYYNGSVRNYNIRVQSFPSILVARLLAFGPREFFEIELATNRLAPSVRAARPGGD